MARQRRCRKILKEYRYDSSFYDETLLTSERSARHIVPLIMQLLNVSSVVDFGCGTGSWLGQFYVRQVKDLLGIDYSSISYEALQIPGKYLRKENIGQPMDFDRQFDLAMSLEVAEHLPESSAATLVSNLVKAAPIVLFSGAIPHQGGTNHINEQWPEYWAELFAEHDYVPVDALRETLWNDDNVAYWYAQNLIFYVKRDCLNNYPALKPFIASTNPKFLTRIHPKVYVRNYKMLKNPMLVCARLGWNLLPRPIRIRLIKPLNKFIWEQISARMG